MLPQKHPATSASFGSDLLVQMTLSDLPDDILRLISFFLDGFDNFNLWMASDPKFKQRLISNIICEFNIKYTTPGTYLWPGNFLKKLERLSRLSLVVDDDLGHLPIENIELYPIESLKYFRLCCNNAYQTMNKNCSFSRNNLTDASVSSNSKIMNFNDLFCNLEHFIIKEIDSKSVLTIDFLCCLPNNLKTLSIPLHHFKLDEKNEHDPINELLKLLPRTLTRLKLFFDESSKDFPAMDWCLLPPNLTKLTTNVTVDIYNSIPKNIVEIKLVSKEYSLKKLSPFLPTGLRSLSLWPSDVIPIDNFLSHLQELDHLELISNSWTSAQVSFITKCTSNLKTLRGCNLYIPDVSSHHFSQHLTTLHLERVDGMTPELIAALPQSINDLILIHFNPLSPAFNFFTLLPKNLKSLSSNFGILENFSLLPKNLKSLRLTAQVCQISRVDVLPPTLEILELHADLPQARISQMPQNLKELVIYYSFVIEDEDVPMLPRGLKKLKLATNQDKTTDASVCHLPPNLEHLETRNTSMTNAAISRLPRSLRFLHMSSNTNFTDECIKDMPRQLLSIHLSRVTQITWRSCKDLPKYLRSLYLPNCKDWNTKVIEMLPASLVDFKVSHGANSMNMAWNVYKLDTSK